MMRLAKKIAGWAKIDFYGIEKSTLVPSRDARCLFLKLVYLSFEKCNQLNIEKKIVSTPKRMRLMIDRALEYLTAGNEVSQSSCCIFIIETIDNSKEVSIVRRIIPL